LGEGVDIALRSIANYPFDTKLYEIETIGTIMTFLSNFKQEKGDKTDIWDKKILHTAIFVEDLIELQKNGLIDGIIPISEFKYEMNKFNSMKESGFKTNSQGDLEFYLNLPDIGLQKHTHPKPILENYVSDYLGEPWNEKYRSELIEEYEAGNKPFIEIDNFIRLTEKGYLKIEEIAKKYEIKSQIKELVEPLITIRYFDTVVREVAVFLESNLRKFHNIDKFGEALIEFHINECIKANKNNYNAGLKVYRQELRTMNRFVRNEFMHNKLIISEDNLRFILMRQSDALDMMEQAFEKMKTV
ncbi:MAG: hypothetical protein RBS48_12170, partial [Ignavibacteriaceae bacterium]|nr:hypothetical protein [Ignavibacteriaceae bacterium]